MMTDAQRTASREDYEREAAAITAMHCRGCPYRTCQGSTATLTYEEQRARFREEAGK